MAETINQQYLVFEVDEEYAVELENVLEIIEFLPVTAVPETPDYIAGIVNLRGQVLPVVDMRARFHKERVEYSPRTCIIVARIEDLKLGLIVDLVNDLVTIPEDQILPPPQVGSDYAHVFIKAIGVAEDKIRLIIDTDRLVNYSDLTSLPGLTTED